MWHISKIIISDCVAGLHHSIVVPELEIRLLQRFELLAHHLQMEHNGNVKRMCTVQYVIQDIPLLSMILKLQQIVWQ